MITIAIIVGWIICGAFAYALAFGWEVDLTESYLSVSDPRHLWQAQRAAMLLIPTGLLGLVLVSGPSLITLPVRRHWLQWRNPAKAMMVIRTFQNL
mgnify:CR=1 FL=1